MGKATQKNMEFSNHTCCNNKEKSKMHKVYNLAEIYNNLKKS